MAIETGIAFVRSRYGPPPAPSRDGDKLQARQRVNVLVRTGRLPHPNTLPCKDCDHRWRIGERKHHYDHFMGYGAAHHYDVEPVCTSCHGKRALDRGEIQIEKLKSAAQTRKAKRKTHCSKGHALSYGNDAMWRCHQCRLEYWKKRGNARHSGVAK